ncbi:MAG TPA: glycosyl hydrolase 53 family protein, partial [Polyangiaceae bacterium]|nr:glycosyl hydrolase 53 family protein [Polyangiaceae bacterium]
MPRALPLFSSLLALVVVACSSDDPVGPASPNGGSTGTATGGGPNAGSGGSSSSFGGTGGASPQGGAPGSGGASSGGGPAGGGMGGSAGSGTGGSPDGGSGASPATGGMASGGASLPAGGSTAGAGAAPQTGGSAGSAADGGSAGSAGMPATGGSGGGVFQVPFILGADISSVQESKMTFRDTDGQTKDIFALLKNHGFNYIRLKTFVDPMSPYGYASKANGCAGLSEAFGDRDHVVAFGKEAKDAGMGFLLDFYYSDVWADPGNQIISEAWRGASTITELA